ncbi:MAG: hypothetical protein EAZ79_29600 [Oscillatoriales cyanobacterium]|nr:MAG: hypothetical protein EAZ79_29600 [Oscillatoriales cyanobacterium]
MFLVLNPKFSQKPGFSPRQSKIFAETRFLATHQRIGRAAISETGFLPRFIVLNANLSQKPGFSPRNERNSIAYLQQTKV